MGGLRAVLWLLVVVVAAVAGLAALVGLAAVTARPPLFLATVRAFWPAGPCRPRPPGPGRVSRPTTRGRPGQIPASCRGGA